MALFGVVFMLGAGQVVAQPAIAIKSVTVGGRAVNTVAEGQLLTVTVTLDKRVPRTQTGVNTVVVTLAEGVMSTDNTPVFTTSEGAHGRTGWAEVNDVVIPNVTITIGEQANSGSATFVTGRDSDAVNEKFRIQATPAKGDGSATSGDGNFTVTTTPVLFAGTIDDAEEQKYELKLKTAVTDPKPKEGGVFEATLRAVPSRPANEIKQAFMYLETGDVIGYNYVTGESNTAVTGVYSVYLGTGTDQTVADAGALVADVSVKAPANDENRTDDTITLQAFTGSAGRNVEAATLDVKVADAQKLPGADAIKGEARDNKKYDDGMTITSIEEGGTAYVFVTVTNTLRDQVDDGEKFSVSLSAADTGQLLDFRVSPSSITVPARDEFTLPADDSERVGPFALEALMDDDIGAETLMLNIDLTTAEPTKKYGAGTSSGSFSIDIMDTTKPLVWVKDGFEDAVYAAKGDDPMYPGDSFEIMTSDLFGMAEGVTVAYSATSDGAAASATASSAMVTVMGEEAGMAEINVTATATMSGAKQLPQTMSNIAQLAFPVEVKAQPMTYMLHGPEDTNLTEGMSAKVTVEASRKVDEDTMVELIQTGGTASPADFTAEPITIKAGEMMGYTMVMAVEDGMAEDMEMLTIEGRVGAMKTNTVTFSLWDAAVPALPIIAQLLLAAFLAIGGYRRYLRR